MVRSGRTTDETCSITLKFTDQIFETNQYMTERKRRGELTVGILEVQSYDCVCWSTTETLSLSLNLSLFVCVCVCVRARARECVFVCACV